MSCSMNVYAVRILYQRNCLKWTTDETNNYAYHNVTEKCGTDICINDDYDLQGTIGDKMIETKIIKTNYYAVLYEYLHIKMCISQNIMN